MRLVEPKQPRVAVFAEGMASPSVSNQKIIISPPFVESNLNPLGKSSKYQGCS